MYTLVYTFLSVPFTFPHPHDRIRTRLFLRVRFSQSELDVRFQIGSYHPWAGHVNQVESILRSTSGNSLTQRPKSGKLAKDEQFCNAIA